MRIPWGRSLGISLVETLISLLILAFALLSMAMVPIMNTRLTASTIWRDQATMVALASLDHLDALSFDGLLLQHGVLFGNAQYSGDVNLQAISGLTDTRRVVVSVTWRSMQQRNTLSVDRQMSRLEK